MSAAASERAMCKSKDCRLQSLGFEHSEPRLFATSQWPLPPLLYVVYRVLMACFFVTWIIVSGAVRYNWVLHNHDRKKWFIYLTNWSFTTLTVSTLLRAACAIYGHVAETRQRPPRREYLKEKAPMPLLYKASWLFYNVSSTAALMVTILFWTFIYPQYHDCTEPEVLTDCGSPCTRTCADLSPLCAESGPKCERRCQCPDDRPLWHDGDCLELEKCPQLDASNVTLSYSKTKIYDIHAISVMTHAGNSMYVLTDIWLTATPMRVLHFWQYGTYAAAYTLFSLLYYHAGGTNAYHKHYIYSVLDWESPQFTAVLVTACGVLGVILWLFLCGLVQLRLWIHRRVVKSKRWLRTRGQSLALFIRESESSFTDMPESPEV